MIARETAALALVPAAAEQLRPRRPRKTHYEATSAPPVADNRQQIKSARDVWQATADFNDTLQEHFVVFDLDSRHKVIARRTVGVGSLNGVEVHPREIFKGAILNSAAAVVFAHNHPSNDAEPSRQDVELTLRLRGVAELVGIAMLDHVVVAKGGYVSMKERGLA